jgi:hypothetical protein
MCRPFLPNLLGCLQAQDEALQIDGARDGFTKKSLRTVQMAVKSWRIETAGQIILDGDWKKRAPLPAPSAASTAGRLRGVTTMRRQPPFAYYG